MIRKKLHIVKAISLSVVIKERKKIKSCYSWLMSRFMEQNFHAYTQMIIYCSNMNTIDINQIKGVRPTFDITINKLINVHVIV